MTSPTTTTTTTTSGAATLTTPAGYTSRFVAHVDHGQSHHQASSNSSNPHERNRFRTFSDGHDEPIVSNDRVEDSEIAATNADYDIYGTMVKPQSNKRTHTDGSTDTDDTITSSPSSSFADKFKSLEGSGYDNSRVENRSEVNEDALMEGRSGNGVNSSLSARNDRRGSLGQSAVRDERYPSVVDTFENSTNPETTTEKISDDGSSSDSDTESSSEGDTDSETDQEENESRDENSNITNKKTENPEKQNGPASEEKSDDSEEESTDSDTNESTVPNVPSNSQNNSLERYDEKSKRRSSSILEERSIEELFDDNGWVITDQDLQPEKPARISKSFKPIDQHDSSASNIESPSTTGNERETGHDGSNDETTGVNGRRLSMSGSSENSSRSRVYRQSSIGKNGWLVSDESENESEVTVENATRKESTERKLESTERIGNGDNPSTPVSTARDKHRVRDKDSNTITDNPWNIDENGWVILNKVNDANKTVANETTDETSTIRSQTTDLVMRASIENGALVANATQSKDTECSNDHEDTSGVDMTIPMQMVTTVFCVSVLCYSVLINLFL